MDATRKPRNTNLTAENIAELHEDTVAIIAVMQGKLDAAVAAFREERLALGAARTIKEMQDEQARLTAANTLLASQGDAIRAENAAARTAKDQIKVETERAAHERAATLQETSMQVAKLKRQAIAEADAIKGAAKDSAVAVQKEIEAAQGLLAEKLAEVKSAQGELNAFRQALIEEKAKAARSLGIGA